MSTRLGAAEEIREAVLSNLGLTVTSNWMFTAELASRPSYQQNCEGFILSVENGNTTRTLKHRFIDINDVAFQYSAAGDLRHDGYRCAFV
jgi:hypothetical protein